MSRFPLFQVIAVGLRNHRLAPAVNISLNEHLTAAIDWIMKAHAGAGYRGISKGFNLLRGRWAPSYPETTGYTIPTLLNVCIALDRPDLKVLALSMADYLLDSTTPEGGVVHWQDNSRSTPIVFDTGQVLLGWLAAFEATNDERYLQAAIRAGDWLVTIQHLSGSWKKYQYLNVEKVIDTRVAWALLRLHQHTKEDIYLQAAVRNLEWAQHQQEANGWFKHCSFINGKNPLTHTLAYTAEGFFECGCLLNEKGFMDAAHCTANALLTNQRHDGSLASTYGPEWRESSRSSCLTGNCQVSRLWLRIFETSNDQDYYDSAKKMIAFVSSTQDLHTSDLNIRGAIAGSYPIYGHYERFKYPNWAAKFYIDALLALDTVESGEKKYPFVG